MENLFVSLMQLSFNDNSVTGYNNNLHLCGFVTLIMACVFFSMIGSGKSALVANWAKKVDTSEPDTFVFIHFIGSSADSASYLKLIRRLVMF